MKSYNERHTNKYSGSNRFVLGAIVILAGILLVLKNVGALPWEVSDIIFSWPMLLIVLGIINLSKRNHLVSGVILLAIGSYFLIPRFTDTPEVFSKFFWGGILMLLGVMIIFRTMLFRNPRTTNALDGEQEDFVDELCIFGGSEKRITSKSFKGGKITSFFGGSNLDFTDSKLADGVSEIDILAVFGGFKLLVPPDWTIKVETIAIMGGVSDKRSKYTDDSSGKILVIKGLAIFGGGEIKNY